MNSLYLTDASFDGEKYTTRISVQLIEAGWYTIEDATNLAPVKISVHLSSISKDRYLFEKTLFTYRENEDNPFAEPVVVHENIEGGSGIFTFLLPMNFQLNYSRLFRPPSRDCLLYTSPSPRDRTRSRMPSSA